MILSINLTCLAKLLRFLEKELQNPGRIPPLHNNKIRIQIIHYFPGFGLYLHGINFIRDLHL
jgi:hypothetical protein